MTYGKDQAFIRARRWRAQSEKRLVKGRGFWRAQWKGFGCWRIAFNGSLIIFRHHPKVLLQRRWLILSLLCLKIFLTIQKKVQPCEPCTTYPLPIFPGLSPSILHNCLFCLNHPQFCTISQVGFCSSVSLSLLNFLFGIPHPPWNAPLQKISSPSHFSKCNPSSTL